MTQPRLDRWVSRQRNYGENMPIPQYYYKSDECPAETAYDKDCICWHDEGTGPFPDERPDDPDTLKEWRFKPANAE